MTDYNDPIFPSYEPFAGRQMLLSRLHHNISDPSHRHAIVYTGHEGMGKTRLLTYIQQSFDESTLSIYMPLADAPLADEEAWLQALLAAMNAILEERNFSLSRIPQLDGVEEMPLRDWFSKVYLLELFNIIRSHRRVLWLFDDAENLLNAAPSLMTYLADLLETYPQLSIVLTIDTEEEDKLSQLAPLVNISLAEQIHRLSNEESRELLLQYQASLDEESIAKIIESTGGHPRYLAHYGNALNHANTVEAKNQVYSESREEFRRLWLKLSRDERFCLTAIASLVYEDPLRPVTAKSIATWLVETDFPMDIIAINAALRGLDYRNIIQHEAQGGLGIATGLMQQWLLENARLDDSSEKLSEKLSLRLIIGVILIIAVLIALLFVIPLPLLIPNNPVPTATLSQ